MNKEPYQIAETGEIVYHDPALVDSVVEVVKRLAQRLRGLSAGEQLDVLADMRRQVGLSPEEASTLFEMARARINNTTESEE